MNDEKRNDVSIKLMDAAKCISKDDVACVLNDALHGEKKLSGINENCSTCCSVSLAELADLVKPSCDRDALLELADEADRSATELLKVNDLDSNRKRRSMRREHAQDLIVVSSRIREALGVER